MSDPQPCRTRSTSASLKLYLRALELDFLKWYKADTGGNRALWQGMIMVACLKQLTLVNNEQHRSVKKDLKTPTCLERMMLLDTV